MKKYLPASFNLHWVKKTSFKYKIVDENNYIYEYVFNFLVFSLLVIVFLYFFFDQYLGEIEISRAQRAQLETFLRLKSLSIGITTGAVLALNFLFSTINIKNLNSIRLLIKECTLEEKNSLHLLRSYYRLFLFINISLFFYTFTGGLRSMFL